MTRVPIEAVSGSYSPVLKLRASRYWFERGPLFSMLADNSVVHLSVLDGAEVGVLGQPNVIPTTSVEIRSQGRCTSDPDLSFKDSRIVWRRPGSEPKSMAAK